MTTQLHADPVIVHNRWQHWWMHRIRRYNVRFIGHAPIEREYKRLEARLRAAIDRLNSLEFFGRNEDFPDLPGTVTGLVTNSCPSSSPG